MRLKIGGDTKLTWRDIVRVLGRQDIIGTPRESIVRKAYRERVLGAIFQRVALEAGGIADLGELRGYACGRAVARVPPRVLTLRLCIRHLRVISAQPPGEVVSYRSQRKDVNVVTPATMQLFCSWLLPHKVRAGTVHCVALWSR